MSYSELKKEANEIIAKSTSVLAVGFSADSNPKTTVVTTDDAVAFLRHTNKTFDVCIWQNGPNAVGYELFIEFLKHAFQKIGTLVVSTPNAELGTNSADCSSWTTDAWENLKFKTEKSPDEKTLFGVRSLAYPDKDKVARLFIYPNVRTHTYDKHNHLWNAVPLGMEGINKHFKIVTDPNEAELFFMGMISCGTVDDFKPSDFAYLDKYPEKHIFELEGDWLSNVAPPWLARLAKSGNSSKPEHLVGPLFVRPAVSKLLSYMAKNPQYELEFPAQKTWCFRGFPDPFGVRVNVVQLAKQLNLPGQFELTSTFGAGQPLTANGVTEYYQMLHNHLIGLCPRGAGVDSIRFYEICFFGRVPVAISDAKWLEENNYDMSFAFRISPSTPRDEMTRELLRIHNFPIEELIERGKRARKYFETVVVNYLKDPTKSFIDYLKRNKLFCENTTSHTTSTFPH